MGSGIAANTFFSLRKVNYQTQVTFMELIACIPLVENEVQLDE